MAEHTHTHAHSQLDMPCLRWAGVTQSGGEAAEPSHACLDEQQAPQALLDARTQLQRWAARRLLELNRDGSPTAVHAQLLRGALANRAVIRAKPEWWKVGGRGGRRGVGRARARNAGIAGHPPEGVQLHRRRVPCSRARNNSRAARHRNTLQQQARTSIT
jgi:hypothetical protein